MIQDVRNRPISELFDVDSRVVYVVPKYQREYTWRRSEWEALFDDLIDNSPGYFLGSLICINQATDALAVQELEIVDGQQRLVTLSLLFAAIYEQLDLCRDLLNEDQRVDLVNLKRKLVLKNSNDQIRVIPQIQNENQRDFRSVLSGIGVIGPQPAPPWAGNRRIVRAFRYFQSRVADMASGSDDRLAPVLSILERVNRACLVKIEVANHADAYTLFESLNNRGVPLTAIDLIKNRLLARLEDREPGRMDYYSGRWSALLSDLGDDYTVQERFMRHFYNAFKNDLNRPFRAESDRRQDPLGPLATRSNIIQIYQQLIDRDPKTFLDQIAKAGSSYSVLLCRSSNHELAPIERSLRDLERIQGAPSYILMLYLLERREHVQTDIRTLTQIVELLVRFFVRRNLTDTPPTRDLTRLFMETVQEVDALRGGALLPVVRSTLTDVSASSELFHQALLGPIYEENSSVTRFILCSLAEQGMTEETWVDLWRTEGRQPIWTIEHILPQEDIIPDSWVDMIAGGDRVQAKAQQKMHVHRLGNLTISVFNSTLGNRSFSEKRDRKDNKGRYVGYRNGLSLNEDLAAAESWSVEQIDLRTRKLAEEAMAVFRLDA